MIKKLILLLTHFYGLKLTKKKLSKLENQVSKLLMVDEKSEQLEKLQRKFLKLEKLTFYILLFS